MKKSLSCGKFGYFSISENLEYLVSNNVIQTSCRDEGKQYLIEMKINVDGLPLFRSSDITLWPLLMTINLYEKPLPIGLFCGQGKPHIKDLLGEFILEVQKVQSAGFTVGSTTFSIGRISFICDAPARSYIQCINSHTGYYACAYCRTKGSYGENRVYFDETDAELRNDIDYEQFNENNQVSRSPLLGVVPLRNNFPPEYMHLILLGIMKKILFYMFFPTKRFQLKCRLSQLQISNLSDRLICLSLSISSL